MKTLLIVAAPALGRPDGTPSPTPLPSAPYFEDWEKQRRFAFGEKRATLAHRSRVRGTRTRADSGRFHA